MRTTWELLHALALQYSLVGDFSIDPPHATTRLAFSCQRARRKTSGVKEALGEGGENGLEPARCVILLESRIDWFALQREYGKYAFMYPPQWLTFNEAI